MLKVLFFGRLRDVAGREQLETPYDPLMANVRLLRQQLGQDNFDLARALAEPQVLIAVNQQLVDPDCLLEDRDEVAFLPPVTGG